MINIQGFKFRNILLTADDEIKICDFGVAVILTETSDAPTIRQGTIYYMSPEMENPPYDSKTDIWYFCFYNYSI